MNGTKTTLIKRKYIEHYFFLLKVIHYPMTKFDEIRTSFRIGRIKKLLHFVCIWSIAKILFKIQNSIIYEI